MNEQPKWFGFPGRFVLSGAYWKWCYARWIVSPSHELSRATAFGRWLWVCLKSQGFHSVQQLRVACGFQQVKCVLARIVLCLMPAVQQEGDAAFREACAVAI